MAINPFSSSVLGQMNPEVQDSESMLLGGLGLGGAAFAAQTGRLPSPTMPGPSSALAQQVAANDAARQAAGRTTASLLGRAGSLLRDPRTLAFGGGFTLGSALDNAFDISGNIAQSLIPDEPTLTREERAALEPTEDSMIGTGRVSGLSSTDRSAPEQVVQAGRLRGRGEFVNPLAGQTVGGEFVPAEPSITTAPVGSATRKSPDAVEEYRALGTDVPPLGGEIAGAGTVLKEPSQIVSEAGVPTMQETIAGLTELTAPTTPTAPALPAGVEPGSPQATFLAERAKGELSPAQIAQAQEFAASMGTTFDPETGYSREPFLQYQAARGMGLRTDPQGRMIPAGFATRAEAFPEYEREAAAREARIAARPDFMEAQPVDKQYTDAQLRDIFGGGDALQRAKAMQDAGIDPVTGKRPEEKTQAEQELEQARLDLIRAQTERARREEPAPDPEAERIARETAQARLDLINKQIEAAGKEDPDKLTKAEQDADRLKLTGEARQAFLLGQLDADVDAILGAGITPPTPDGAGKDSLGLGL